MRNTRRHRHRTGHHRECLTSTETRFAGNQITSLCILSQEFLYLNLKQEASVISFFSPSLFSIEKFVSLVQKQWHEELWNTLLSPLLTMHYSVHSDSHATKTTSNNSVLHLLPVFRSTHIYTPLNDTHPSPSPPPPLLLVPLLAMMRHFERKSPWAPNMMRPSVNQKGEREDRCWFWETFSMPILPHRFFFPLSFPAVI